MSTDPIKRFDVPDPPSSLSAAGAMLKAQWGAVVALTCVTCCALCAAVVLLLSDAVVSSTIGASIEATRIYVVMAPAAARSDAEALASPIKAMSNVAAATLETKEDALKALAATGLPLPEGRNPLPDTWVVTLHSGPTMSRSAAFVTDVADARRALAALPHVDSTRVDDRWVANVQDRLEAWKRGWPILQIAGLGGMVLLVMSGAFLAARAIISCAERNPIESKLVPTLLTIVVFVASILIVGATDALAAIALNERVPALVQAQLTHLFTTEGWPSMGVACGALLALMVGASLGVRRTR